MKEQLSPYRERCHRDPQVIFLQNHGVFVSEKDIAEIDDIYRRIMEILQRHIRREGRR